MPDNARASALLIVEFVVRDHAEAAAFQWAQRDTLADEDPPDTEAIADVDTRLVANLDGLAIAGAAAWPALITAFEDFPEKGELFALTHHALARGEPRRLDKALGFARAAAPEAQRGFFGAFEWLPPAKTGATVRAWLHASGAVKCEAALSALIAHRADPGDLLAGLLRHPHPGPRAAAARLAGALGRTDAAPALTALLDDPEVPPREAAALALAALGDAGAITPLKARVRAMAPGWPKALRSLIATGDADELKRWFSALNDVPETRPVAVRAVGMLGDTSLAPWLLRRAKDPETAKHAAAAIYDLYPASRSDESWWRFEEDEDSSDFIRFLDIEAAKERLRVPPQG